jgi:hypothetical protein
VTLVQVLADETSLHMACDFCMTNPDTGKVIKMTSSSWSPSGEPPHGRSSA